MRKKDEKLSADILNTARAMADESGIDSINMRSIAERVGVATGTVYNYYPSKDDILLTLTEEYWHKALSQLSDADKPDRFYDQVEEIFSFLNSHFEQGAQVWMGSLANVEIAGREKMRSLLESLKEYLISRMERDEKIDADLWSEDFTKEQFASFLIANLVTLMASEKPYINFLVEVVKRTLY